MNRRDLLLAVGALPALALAQPSNITSRVVDVAKIMRFSCPSCLAAEPHDRVIAEEVKKHGGRFVRAPIPEKASSLGARERVYFAARSLGEALESGVRASLYRGSQDAQVQLETYAQVYYWLEQDLPSEINQFPKLFEGAQAQAAGDALQRALRLTVNAGVEVLPTYVILVNGAIATTVDKGSSGSDTHAALRDAVIAAIRSS